MRFSLLASATTVAALFAATGAYAQSQACPDWTGQGQQLSFGAMDLVMGQSTPIIAGGNVDLSQCNIPGGANGYVITSPDFDLSFSDNPDGMAMILSVQGDCDTVLLVNDAAGTWHFNDDANESLQPMIIIGNAPVGAYDIWVGTYGPQTCNATLSLALEGGEGDEGGDGGKGEGSAPVYERAPSTMVAYRGQTGAVYQFALTGSASGTVWGSGVYTDDSSVAAAAVHAGVLAEGESGIVTIAVVGGQPSYPGSAANGIQTRDYGSWDGSFQFLDEQGNPITVDVGGQEK